MSHATDLVRLGELIKLAAETAADLADSSAGADESRILTCAKDLEDAAEKLMEIGRGQAQSDRD